MKIDQIFPPIFAFVAAVIASLALADIFVLAHVPNIVVAALALISAGVLALGVAVAAVIEKLANWDEW